MKFFLLHFQILNKMKEKKAFIFFVCDPKAQFKPFFRNEEIFKLYLNRITIDEDDQMEVLRIEQVEQMDVCSPSIKLNKRPFLTALKYYESLVKEVKVSQQI